MIGIPQSGIEFPYNTIARAVMILASIQLSPDFVTQWGRFMMPGAGE
jgi:hypothetical protein